MFVFSLFLVCGLTQLKVFARSTSPYSYSILKFANSDYEPITVRKHVNNYAEHEPYYVNEEFGSIKKRYDY